MPIQPAPDPKRLYRALEALLRAPQTGQAVAETLICQAVERDLRCMVADLRARRSATLRDREIDGIEAARSEALARKTPWARPV